MARDETAKAASVAQLQELAATLPNLIDAAVEKAVTAAIGGASAVFDQRMSAGEKSHADLRAAMPAPQDLGPLIAAIERNTQAVMMAMAKDDAPRTKIGTATIGGETITLKISEAVN